MQRANQIVGGLLTAATSTPPARRSIVQIDRFPQFETFADPQLVLLKETACEFLAALKENRPKWLTMLGPCGVGKTYLARALYRLAKEQRAPKHDPEKPQKWDTLLSPFRFVDWRAFCEKLLAQEWHLVEEVCDAWFVVLDDIGTVFDKDGLLESKLDRILNSRLGMFTVITTNVRLQDLDPRIRSRIFRDGGLVVELPADVLDYAIRNEKGQR